MLKTVTVRRGESEYFGSDLDRNPWIDWDQTDCTREPLHFTWPAAILKLPPVVLFLMWPSFRKSRSSEGHVGLHCESGNIRDGARKIGYRQRCEWLYADHQQRVSVGLSNRSHYMYLGWHWVSVTFKLVYFWQAFSNAILQTLVQPSRTWKSILKSRRWVLSRYHDVHAVSVLSTSSELYMYRLGQKLDYFWELITLRRL